MLLDKLTGDCTDAESIRNAVILQTALPETAAPGTTARGRDGTCAADKPWVSGPYRAAGPVGQVGLRARGGHLGAVGRPWPPDGFRPDAAAPRSSATVSAGGGLLLDRLMA